MRLVNTECDCPRCAHISSDDLSNSEFYFSYISDEGVTQRWQHWQTARRHCLNVPKFSRKQLHNKLLWKHTLMDFETVRNSIEVCWTRTTILAFWEFMNLKCCSRQQITSHSYSKIRWGLRDTISRKQCNGCIIKVSLRSLNQLCSLHLEMSAAPHSSAFVIKWQNINLDVEKQWRKFFS